MRGCIRSLRNAWKARGMHRTRRPRRRSIPRLAPFCHARASSDAFPSNVETACRVAARPQRHCDSRSAHPRFPTNFFSRDRSSVFPHARSRDFFFFVEINSLRFGQLSNYFSFLSFKFSNLLDVCIFSMRVSS